ncbi:MAG: hypothetical protein AAGA18_04675 [Verrucomicrobiota bacterium]
MEGSGIAAKETDPLELGASVEGKLSTTSVVRIAIPFEVLVGPNGIGKNGSIRNRII